MVLRHAVVAMMLCQKEEMLLRYAVTPCCYASCLLLRRRLLITLPLHYACRRRAIIFRCCLLCRAIRGDAAGARHMLASRRCFRDAAIIIFMPLFHYATRAAID